MQQPGELDDRPTVESLTGGNVHEARHSVRRMQDSSTGYQRQGGTTSRDLDTDCVLQCRPVQRCCSLGVSALALTSGTWLLELRADLKYYADYHNTVIRIKSR